MRILLLFIFSFSTIVCLGQTEVTVGDIIKAFDNGSNTDIDYLTPCPSELTKAFWELEEWVTIDTFYLYQAWIAKEINKNFEGKNYLDIRIDVDFNYYYHFIENNDTVQILKVPSVGFWHSQRDTVELKSEFSTWISDKKTNKKLKRICETAINEANYKKQGKPGMCCVGPTTISAGYKSAYYTCPKGYKTQLLQTLIDYTIQVPILLEQKIDLELLQKQVDELMQAYDLE